MKKYEVFQFNNCGYQKLFTYNSWRIAMLNYIDELIIEKVEYFEAHSTSDEAFILLEGECRMYLLSYDENNNESIDYFDLEKNKLYVVKKDIYHTHILTEDAKIIVIEEEDVNYENSPRVYIDDKLRKLMKDSKD